MILTNSEKLELNPNEYKLEKVMHFTYNNNLFKFEKNSNKKEIENKNITQKAIKQRP